MTYPLQRAWVMVTSVASFSSLISSRVPSRPALKNTYVVKWKKLVISAHGYNRTTVQVKIYNLWWTFVCPNLYWVWSTSMEPSSFSEAFLLSMNCPSGMTLAFNTLYLQGNVCSFIFTSQFPSVLHHNALLKSTWIASMTSRSPLLEVTIEDSAGEALSADSDTLQHTITPQLVDDQEVLHKTCTL